MKKLLFILIGISLASCTQDPAKTLVLKSVAYHGFDRLNTEAITFTFRGATYTVDRNFKGETLYTKSFKQFDTIRQDSIQLNDSLFNSSAFKRYASGQLMDLSDKDNDRFSQSLNSVGYFFQLPLPLLDEAAQLTLLENIIIKGKAFNTLAVSFTPNQGGQDHQDTFRYYFDTETHALSYLSYAYETNGGGIRFRVATPFAHDGFIFLNYLNYKPAEEVSLDSLPALYEAGALELVSEISNSIE
ncbi:MAG: DUF6503 family protein [Flavobacteriaceae bacterium]